MDQTRLADIIEIEQLLARYAVAMTQLDVDGVIDVFAPGGAYHAFGDAYGTDSFPDLVLAAPPGLYSTGTPAITFDEHDADRATGHQTLLFVAQATHEQRLGWYTDQYTRTADGWRLQERAITFLRRSGDRDSGRPHDPRRPAPRAAVQD
jgi:hypothetical protein